MSLVFATCALGRQSPLERVLDSADWSLLLAHIFRCQISEVDCAYCVLPKFQTYSYTENGFFSIERGVQHNWVDLSPVSTKKNFIYTYDSSK